MEEKLLALKTLGFNYITRNMLGELSAWKVKPKRVIFCTTDKAEEALRIYGEDTSINAVDVEEKPETGYQIGLCSFAFSKFYDSDFQKYAWIPLCDTNNEFKDITWENSPFEIPS